MKVQIISLSGHIGSGKNEIANIAVKQFGYKPLMLAGLAKSVVSQVYGVSLEQLEDRRYKEQWRPLVIKYAETMKEADLYVHCKYVYELIRKDLNNCGGGKYVLSDMRWPYECSFFRKFDRCSQHFCELDYEGFKGYEVSYKALYVNSDLADKSSKDESEFYIETYFAKSKNNDGVIFNGLEERYESRKDKVNPRLINQLIKYL